MPTNYTTKINFIFFNIGLFFFLFLWDIKFNFYQLRFVILLPLITLLIDQANYEIKKLLKIILIPTLILFHLLIIGYLNNYNFDNRDIFGILFLYLIFY